MKKYYTRSAAFLLTLISLAITVCVLGSTAYAQTVPMRDTSSAERTLSALESESRREKRDASTILAEINEDFERFRIINEEIKTAASANAPINFKYLSNNAVEIKKRGNRLKGNLAALPKPEKDEKTAKEPTPADDAQMRSFLATVNAVMTSFLTNPVFSDMGTIDNQLAARARRDLDNLIAMSDVLKNGAEKLSKRH
jgi:hypothetical protein